MSCTLKRASKRSTDFINSKTVRQLRDVVNKADDLKQAMATLDSAARRRRQSLCKLIKSSWKSSNNIEISNSQNSNTDDYEIEHSVVLRPPNPFTYDGKSIDAGAVQRKRAMDLDLLKYHTLPFSKLYSDQTEIVKRAGFDKSEIEADDADTLELFAYHQKLDTFAIFFDNGKGRTYMITFRIRKTGRYVAVKKKILVKDDAQSISSTSSKRNKMVISKLPAGYVVLFG